MKKITIILVTFTIIIGSGLGSYAQKPPETKQNIEIGDRIQTEVQRNLQSTITLMNSILLLLNLLLVGTGITIFLTRNMIINHLVQISRKELETFLNTAKKELTESLNKSLDKQAEFIIEIETKQNQSIDKFRTAIVDETKILIQEIKAQQSLLEHSIVKFQEITQNTENYQNSGILRENREKNQLVSVAYDYFNQGNELFSNHRYEEANNYYNEALKIDKNLADIRYQNARCYALRRNTNLAVGNLQWAIDINPEYKNQAQTDFAFDLIRSDLNFNKMIQV
jgi:tetratricopeptide (TPR) repeat protein